MNRKLMQLKWIIVSITFLVGKVCVYAQDGETLYKTNCAACHNIEGTPLMGPNLKNVTQVRSKTWVKQFIANPSQMYESGDAQAKAIIDEYKGVTMPAFSFSDQQLEAIISYIDAQGGTKTSVTRADTTRVKSDSFKLLKEDRYSIHRGFELFAGKIPFQHRGSSCISCHNANYDDFTQGGTMSRDLTHVYSRMNKNETALRSVIQSMPFPAMAEAYKKHPLTADEIEYLVLFLKHVDSIGQPTSLDHSFVLTGITAAGLLVILLAILYRRGKIRSVNFYIHARQERKNE